MPALQVNDTLPLVGTTRQDIYDLIEGSTPDTDFFDGITLETSSNKGQAKVCVPRWEKVTIGHAAIAALGAVSNGQVTLLTLQDGGIVQAVKIMSKVQWVGSGIATLVADVGLATAATKYLTGYNLLTAPANDQFATSSTFGAEAHTLAGGGSGTALKLKVTATGTTLNAISAGSVDVWILWSATV